MGECEKVLAAPRPQDLLHTCQRRLHERLAGLGQLVSLARHVAGGHCVILLPGVVAAGEVLNRANIGQRRSAAGIASYFQKETHLVFILLAALIVTVEASRLRRLPTGPVCLRPTEVQVFESILLLAIRAC